MKTIKKIDEYISEQGKPLSASKLKWAGIRAKDMGNSVENLKEDLANNDMAGIRASLAVIKDLVGTIERGLKL